MLASVALPKWICDSLESKPDLLDLNYAIPAPVGSLSQWIERETRHCGRSGVDRTFFEALFLPIRPTRDLTSDRLCNTILPAIAQYFASPGPQLSEENFANLVGQHLQDNTKAHVFPLYSHEDMTLLTGDRFGEEAIEIFGISGHCPFCDLKRKEKEKIRIHALSDLLPTGESELASPNTPDRHKVRLVSPSPIMVSLEWLRCTSPTDRSVIEALQI